MRKNVIGVGVAAAFLVGLAGSPAIAGSMGYDDEYEGSPSAEGMAFDGVLVRPVSLVGSLVSTLFFVVSLPFSATGGNVDEAAHSMVAEPFQYTFKRPLGRDE
jgi:hypothetical protein